MTQTTNMGLKKIEGTDDWRNLTDYHNDSMDIVDQKVGAVPSGHSVQEEIVKLQLMAESLEGCTATPTFNNDGDVTQVVHAINGTTKRTDVYTRMSTTITEVRTLSSGEVLTITTTLATGAQSFVYSNFS